jgi:hypothetical protein
MPYSRAHTKKYILCKNKNPLLITTHSLARSLSLSFSLSFSGFMVAAFSDIHLQLIRNTLATHTTTHPHTGIMVAAFLCAAMVVAIYLRTLHVNPPTSSWNRSPPPPPPHNHTLD